eukprot:s1926_g11.t2
MPKPTLRIALQLCVKLTEPRIAEHRGRLADEATEDQGPPDEEAPASPADPSTSTVADRPDEVALVVAFRGTNSVTNVATDVRISLTPLAEESKTGPFGSAHGQQPVCFDLKDKVKARLSSQEEMQARSTNPFSPTHAQAQARAPLRSGRQDSRASDSADEQDSDSDSWLSGCCRVLAGCCSRVFFPFLPSDFEDDDEELSLEALDKVRVHKGFAEAYGAVRTDERLLYWAEKDVPVRVYATGHSLGGAIANLFALDLSAAPQHDSARRFPFRDPVEVYTFGSPRNASFRSLYNSLVPQTFRIVGSRDIVPTLPPSIAYRQLGREVWVDDAGDAWLRPDLLMESAVSDLATKELTFVMSWAMRHILPARDSEARLHDAPVSARLSVAVTKIWYHSLVSYYALLNRSYMRKTGQHDPQLMILCRYREVSSARASIEQDVPIRIPRGVQRARGWAPKALCPWESEEGSGIVLTVRRLTVAGRFARAEASADKTPRISGCTSHKRYATISPLAVGLQKMDKEPIDLRDRAASASAIETRIFVALQQAWAQAGCGSAAPRLRFIGLMSPLQAWLSCTARAEERAAHGLGRVAKACAGSPWRCILLTVLGCLLCAVGVLRFTAVSEARELWVDQGSKAMKDLEWTEQYFVSRGRMNRVLVTSKDGGNILRLETMAEIFRLADDVKALSDGDGTTFADLCLRVTSGCLNPGVRRYFGTGTTADFNQTVQTQADILVAVNKANFPDGAPAFADDSLGGIERDGNGSITSATAARVDFILSADSEDMMTKWEEALVEHFTRDQLTNQGYAHVDAFVQAQRSQDDELNRTVRADIPLFAVAFVLMAAFCSVFLGKTASWTQSRRLLGAVEFYLVLFGCIAGYGTSMLIGIPFTVLQQILPFILVGIGIDDAFVISGAFDAIDPSLSIPDRIEKAMQRVGVSITLTKVTSISSFLLGATGIFPSVQYFCAYAAISCFYIWLLHCTTFCALLALDARRAEADPPRLDPCFCLAAGPSCMPSKKSSEGTSILETALVAMIKFLTSHPAISFTTIILFLVVAVVSAWQVSLGLSTDFDIMDLSPDQSFLRDFYNMENLHFGGLSTGGLALPTAFYVADKDFSSLALQRHLEEAGAGLMALSNINSVRGLQSWHTIFTVWAVQNKGVLASLPDSAFTAVETNRTGCEAGLPSGVTTCTSHLVTGTTFLTALQEFLATPRGRAFEDDVVIQNGQIKVIRLRANHIDTFNSKQQIALLEEMEAFTEQWQSALPGSFMSSQVYIFFDQYRIIVQQMTISIGLCLGAVLLISALVLAHPLSVLVVLLVLALVFMDLMGNIVLWSLALNSISMINLIMAVGLVVDYSMHMAHSFGLQDGSLPGPKRAELAMKEMGQPIFLGVSTTFLAILPLASSSQAFRIFFQMFFGIVVAGGSHGLIFLPVCMSVLSPKNKSTKLLEISNLDAEATGDKLGKGIQDTE